MYTIYVHSNIVYIRICITDSNAYFSSRSIIYILVVMESDCEVLSFVSPRSEHTVSNSNGS